MQTIREILNEKARIYGDKTALVFESEHYSFTRVNERINRLNNALAGMGMRKGDHAGILSYNSHRYFEVFGVAKAGFVCVPLNYRSSARELAYFINNAEIKALFFEKEFGQLVDSVRQEAGGVENFICLDGALENIPGYEDLLGDSPPDEPDNEVNEEDNAVLFYTSGTTSLPKGGVHTHRSVVAEMVVPHRELSSRDVALCVMPFFHVGGMAAYLLPAFYFGATAVILNKYDAEVALRTIEREKVTNICVVPVMLTRMLDHPDFYKYDLSSLRTIVYTGAPMPQETLRRGLEAFGNIFVQALGQTEANLISVLSKDDHSRGMLPGGLKILESVGKPFYPGELRLVDEHDQDVSLGEVGEIIVKNDRIMKEYWKQPEQTAEVIKEGWLHTGDMGRMDQDGYIYLVDRSKDMIISGGENIYSREVEQVLETHPSVQEAAVIGVPDEKWGESVKAVIVLRPGETMCEDECIEYCKERLASYKKPRSVEFWDNLPKNPSGKILKKEIREKYWEGYQKRIH